MQLPSLEDWPILQEIAQERDRGAAVIAGGFLDAKLTETIRICLRQDKDASNRMFKPGGPLGGFANKAQLGYLLSLYRKETLADFLLIGEIRNRFAHVADPINFGDNYIRERCEKITLYRRVWSIIPTFEFDPFPLSSSAARHLYLESISLAANFLHHQTKHAEYRTRAEELLPF